MLYSALSETNFINRGNRLDIKDWNFISTLDINYQSNGWNGGVHVSLNGFMMVQEEFVEIMDDKTYNDKTRRQDLQSLLNCQQSNQFK